MAAPILTNGTLDISTIRLPLQSLQQGHLYVYAGFTCTVYGAFLFIFSVYTMGKNFEIRAKQRSSSQLITQWPFSWVRNPVYLAGVFLSFGWSMIFWSFLSLIGSILLLITLLIKIQFEEKYLKRQFGKPYLDYIKQVPRIVPKRFF